MITIGEVLNMLCKSCGAKVKEGTETCPSCGFLVLTFIFSAIAVMYELKALKVTGEAFKKA